MTRLQATLMRKDFSRVIGRVQFGGERILLERNGREAAAIVPIEDLRLLEELEDRALIQAADEAEATATGELTLDEMKARLGM